MGKRQDTVGPVPKSTFEAYLKYFKAEDYDALDPEKQRRIRKVLGSYHAQKWTAIKTLSPSSAKARYIENMKGATQVFVDMVLGRKTREVALKEIEELTKDYPLYVNTLKILARDFGF